MPYKVFMSVGSTATEQQEEFIVAIENRLRKEGLVPQSVGRTTFTAGSPLKAVEELFDECLGAVIVALERYYFEEGVEKRGGLEEKPLSKIKLPTSWNQIEAAMSHARGLPLLVIVEKGIKSEGLLEQGHDWYVQYVNPSSSSLETEEFNGVLSSWKMKIKEFHEKKSRMGLLSVDPANLTLGELVNIFKSRYVKIFLLLFLFIIFSAYAFGRKFPDLPANIEFLFRQSTRKILELM